MKRFFLLGIGCVFAIKGFTQPLFTYGANEVSKDEFVNAFNRNVTNQDNKEQAAKEYLDLYKKYKLKVKFAKDLKLDTLAQFRYDLLNFRSRLEKDFPFDAKEAIAKTNLKKNPAVKEEDLFRYADSVTLLPWDHPHPIEKATMFTMANTPVKAKEWLLFVKEYKLNYHVYKGESYPVLLDSFIAKTACNFYRSHLEDYNSNFKYQLQEFKEGNLVYELMNKRVWNKSVNDIAGLKAYYEANKQHYLWQASADVILVNAKVYAYADYALESMKNGIDWRSIAETSENMILADSGKYEIAQLPIKPGVALLEGKFTDIIKNEADGGAAFVKVIKIYPVKKLRSFEEAKNLVIKDYQNYLEENLVNELQKKYPVKINYSTFQSLLK